MTHHVIIGAGPAALNAIETIRLYDNGVSRITLVCDEPPYARMVLPYYLANEITQERIFTSDQAYFDELKVECRFGQRVASIQPEQKQVVLKNGNPLAFDNLLIATGSSPVVPQLPGIDLAGVQPLWTLDQAEAVLQAAVGRPQPEVLFLGAGFIGFTVLNGLFKRGWKIHLVEQSPQLLPRMLDKASAGFVAQWLKQKGVKLHLGTTVRAITHQGERHHVKLASGLIVEVDAVIVATGIRPNLELVQGSGLHVDKGLVVNDRMQTNFSFIYAAGDVTQGPDLLGGLPSVHAIQTTAVDQGRVAGANMAGKEVKYPGSLLMNILDACGLQCASFGLWDDPAAETMVIQNPDRPVYRKLLWSGTQLIGAIFVAPPSEAGMLPDIGMVKGFIQTKTRFGAWKEFVRQNPFDLRRPFIGLRVAQKLVETTLLGQPTTPRKYRFRHIPVVPQVTQPEAHDAYVETKG